MDFTFTLSGVDIPGRLPFMPSRFRLHDAQLAALGIDPAAEGPQTLDDVDADQLGTVNAAAIGLCWNGPPLDVEPLRRFQYDVCRYGDACFEALMQAGHSAAEIITVGGDLVRKVVDSIPTEEALEDAADPSEAPAEPSTGSTSSSG